MYLRKNKFNLHKVRQIIALLVKIKIPSCLIIPYEYEFLPWVFY